VELFKGKEVRCGQQGPHYGEIGIVKSIRVDGVNILWQGNLLGITYFWGAEILLSLREVKR